MIMRGSTHTGEGYPYKREGSANTRYNVDRPPHKLSTRNPILYVSPCMQCPEQANARKQMCGCLGHRGGGHRGKTGRGHNRHRASLGYDDNVLGSGGGDGCAPPRTHWKPQNPSARQTATCVGLLVRLENARGHEATATELALVGLLPSV